MKKTLEFPDLEQWLSACEAREITAAVVRQVSEIRPISGEGHSVIVGHVRWADVIAYRDGVVLKARLHDHPPNLKATLEARGFTVRQVSDNVT